MEPKIYAYMQDGRIYQIVPASFDDEGNYIPLEERFTPEFVADCVDITDVSPQPQPNDAGTKNPDGTWSFSPYSPPPPTAAEILAANTATRNTLLAAAALAIAPLQDAVDLGEATAQETALLTQWKQFRVTVNRIDLTKANPPWPQAPQPGYGAAMANPTS